MRIFRLVRYLAPRSLWIGFLFAFLSCVSVIRPPRPVATAPRDRLQVRELIDRLQQAPVAVDSDVLARMRRRWLGFSLGCKTDFPAFPLPDIDDILVLCYGIPVVPWLKRIGNRQWKIWLDHLAQTLRARYPDHPDIQSDEAWASWIERHVRYVETHFAKLAGQRIAQILSVLPPEPGQIYLFGHSAGGAAVLEYLADLRDEIVPPPARPIRAAITLNAAVAGPARAWTGWPIAPERPSKIDRLIPRYHRYLAIWPKPIHWSRHLTWGRNYLGFPFRGLGTWASQQGMALLTVCNDADLFGHSQLDDIPHVKLQIGRRYHIRGTFTGQIHLSVQRDPRMPSFIWWYDGIA